MEKSIRTLLDNKTIERERNKKRYDLRPLILDLELTRTDNYLVRIHMHLLARSGATGRPDEVLKELGIDPAYCEIERTHIYFND